MANKDRWGVIAVRKDAKGRITQFRCVKIQTTGDPTPAATDFNYDRVASEILQGNELWTAFPDGRELRLDAQLEVVVRTHPDARPAENLDDLPTF